MVKCDCGKEMSETDGFEFSHFEYGTAPFSRGLNPRSTMDAATAVPKRTITNTSDVIWKDVPGAAGRPYPVIAI